ncbi:MAG TPA: TetR/AcrR family transcriptional regulator [Chitinophagaceae bacterium]|jgi:AcrR family transcriptional regulator|nr:TetR/AcrR family transcriptional regulator [Chitinophagaceae bacterium]
MTDIDNKERIKIQATDLFKRYGIRSVSMDDIANQLGMSKKTIYQFYADKDELVEYVINDEIHHNEMCCQADMNQSENAVHELFLAMDMVLEMFRTMNPSVLYDMEKYHPRAFQKFLKHKNDYLYNVIRENLIRGIKEDLYRSDINIDIISRYRVEMVMLPLNPVFQAKVKHNLAEIEEEIILHYLFGLVNMKGYKLILKYKQERTKKTESDAKIK